MAYSLLINTNTHKIYTVWLQPFIQSVVKCTCECACISFHTCIMAMDCIHICLEQVSCTLRSKKNVQCMQMHFAELAAVVVNCLTDTNGEKNDLTMHFFRCLSLSLSIARALLFAAFFFRSFATIFQLLWMNSSVSRRWNNTNVRNRSSNNQKKANIISLYSEVHNEYTLPCNKVHIIS